MAQLLDEFLRGRVENACQTMKGFQGYVSLARFNVLILPPRETIVHHIELSKALGLPSLLDLTSYGFKETFVSHTSVYSPFSMFCRRPYMGALVLAS